MLYNDEDDTAVVVAKKTLSLAKINFCMHYMYKSELKILLKLNSCACCCIFEAQSTKKCAQLNFVSHCILANKSSIIHLHNTTRTCPHRIPNHSLKYVNICSFVFVPTIDLIKNSFSTSLSVDELSFDPIHVASKRRNDITFYFVRILPKICVSSTVSLDYYYY